MGKYRENSADNPGPALFAVISVISLTAILVPIFEYLDRRALKKVAPGKENVATDPSEIQLHFPEFNKREGSPEAKLNVYHLFFSLFKYQKIFRRSLRVCLFGSNISLIIFMSNVILIKSTIDAFLTGLITGVSVFLPALFITFVFIKKIAILKIIGAGMMFAMCMTALIGSFFLYTSTSLGFSLIIGIIIELVVNESAIVFIYSAS